MSEGIKTVIYPVKDLAAAKQIFGQLAGVEPYSDEAYYVGFKVEGQDVGLRANRRGCNCAGPGTEGRRRPAHRHRHRS